MNYRVNKILIVTVAVIVVLLVGIYLLASFTSLLSPLLKVPLVGNLAKKNIEGYHAVFLSNDQVYFGRLRNEESQYPILTDVYYLRQSAELGDENQAGKLDLVKRGRELHGPENMMKINRDHILFIEKVRPDSAIGQAIQKAKQLIPAVLTPQATAPSPTKERFVKIKESDMGFLRVRNESNADSIEVGQVITGKSFKVLNEKEGWYKIEYETGKTGWVSGSYVVVE